jgi:hypothetical protein
VIPPKNPWSGCIPAGGLNLNRDSVIGGFHSGVSENLVTLHILLRHGLT